MPKVSVIIPTHNRSNLLIEAIKSVINQSYQDYEILVIDDASTDDTEEVIKSINNEKIIYIKNESSMGGSQTRNIGIKRSSGEYIAFLDDDDIWLENKLEKQIKIIKENEDVGIVSCSNIEIDNNYNIVGEKLRNSFKLMKNKEAFHKMLVENFIGGASNVLIRKKCLEEVNGFTPCLKSAQETNLYIKILSKGWDLFVCPEILVLYRIHSLYRISDNVEAKKEGLEQLFKFSKKFFNIIPEETKNQIVMTHFVKLYSLYSKNGYYDMARDQAKKLLLNKFSLIAIKIYIKSLFTPLKETKIYSKTREIKMKRNCDFLNNKWKDLIVQYLEIMNI